jgi:hypothetical protein
VNEVELREEVEQWDLSSSISPPAIVVVLQIGGEGGVAGVSTRIYIRIPSN